MRLITVVLILICFTTRGQGIVIEECNIPNYRTEAIDNYTGQALAISNVLRKLYSPSSLRRLSPSYKLTQEDWDKMSNSFINSFPKSFTFEALVISRPLTNGSGAVLRHTYGILNPDKTVTAYATIELSFDISGEKSLITLIKILNGGALLKTALTEKEYLSYKKTKEEIPPPPPHIKD